MKKIRKNFQYPVIKDEDYVFGSGQVTGNVLREDGDWRPYLPPEEHQRRNGVESSACFIEAQQHTIATILEEEFGVLDQNFSARFNLIFAQATPNGGDPLIGAQSIRTYGLIPDSFLPFSDDIKSWQEFNSFKGADRNDCIEQGKVWRRYWEPKYDVVVTREMDLETKYTLLKEALKYSPLPVSVYGVQSGGTYIKKPKGTRDTHMVQLVYIDSDNCAYVWDTYEPFLKKLPSKYNFDFAMRWNIQKLPLLQMSLIKKIISLLNQWLKIEIEEEVKQKPELNSRTLPVNNPTPEPRGSLLLEWATAIRDYEGNPGDLNYRNNNPGNLRSIKGPFLKFKTWEEGWNALLDYLTRSATGKHKAYPKGGETTLQEFFHIYAPKADNNNPDAYAKYVAKRLSVDTKEKIKNLI